MITKRKVLGKKNKDNLHSHSTSYVQMYLWERTKHACIQFMPMITEVNLYIFVHNLETTRRIWCIFFNAQNFFSKLKKELLFIQTFLGNKYTYISGHIRLNSLQIKLIWVLFLPSKTGGLLLGKLRYEWLQQLQLSLVMVTDRNIEK